MENSNPLSSSLHFFETNLLRNSLPSFNNSCSRTLPYDDSFANVLWALSLSIISTLQTPVVNPTRHFLSAASTEVSTAGQKCYNREDCDHDSLVVTSLEWSSDRDWRRLPLITTVTIQYLLHAPPIVPLLLFWVDNPTSLFTGNIETR